MIWAYDIEGPLTQPGRAVSSIVCASVARDNGPARTAELLDRDGAVAFVRERLTAGDHLVGCYVSFDLASTCAENPLLLDVVFPALERGQIHDIAIREALADIAKGELVEHGDDTGARYPLDALVLRHLGIDISGAKHGDGWRRSYALLAGIPFERWPAAAREYSLDDARHTLAVYQAQESKYGGPCPHCNGTGQGSRPSIRCEFCIGAGIRAEFNFHRETEEVCADFALRLASVWGFRANGEAVRVLRERVEGEWGHTLAELQAAGIYRADGSKDLARVRQLVSAAYGGQPPYTSPSKRTPDGQIATDRDTCLESGDVVLIKYGTSGKSDKYRTTYLPKLEEAVEHPFNPFFNVLVGTGRVSSDTQQLPQRGGVRECIEARPGHAFSSVDYGGLELRTMSQWALDCLGYSLMAEFLNSGKDTHAHVAAQFLGTTYDDFLAKLKGPKKAVVKPFRDLGKIFNFGKGGGMGPKAIVYNARVGKSGETTTAPDGTVYTGTRFCVLIGGESRCGIEKVDGFVQGKPRRLCRRCVEIATTLSNDWLKAWPEQGELFRRAAKLAEDFPEGYDVVCPRTGWVRGRCGYTQILNTPFQRLAAVGAKRATWRVSREMHTDRRSPLWGSHILLMVHDELICEHPEDVAPEAAERVGVIMRAAMAELVPDLVRSLEAEPALCRTMSKSMATVRDENGRLRLWTPEIAKP